MKRRKQSRTANPQVLSASPRIRRRGFSWCVLGPAAHRFPGRAILPVRPPCPGIPCSRLVTVAPAPDARLPFEAAALDAARVVPVTPVSLRNWDADEPRSTAALVRVATRFFAAAPDRNRRHAGPAPVPPASVVLARVHSAAVLRRLATDNGNSGLVALAAVLRADSAPPNTDADRPAAGPARAQRCDSMSPIRCDLAPMRYPKVSPHRGGASGRHPWKYAGGRR